ncbi:DUF3231 family protein [Paenibacillus sp. BSR1-1]|uniref:DUF3231 family protein n=1 Tax=Paenibacillus sp. BSR1-1 TaxID=3020845 RepID=UPI0025B170CD|nr:DUF3231 family protein [Paenibacillus sp. BSR1-1]MDN3019921.1 DUF3231 family protein [Paenibacillus sp. BSR1-1]
MNSEDNIRLTSAEIAQLWTGYMNNSMSKCVLKYFKEKTQDEEIRTVINLAISISDQMLQNIAEIYVKENHPIPVAFSENEDVNVNAPALYSDTFFLNFVHNMSRHGLSAYSAALSGCTRFDVLELFSSAVDLTRELYFKSLNVSLETGLYSRAAYIPIPDKVEFIEKQGYLTGWFGERRPINSIEIMHFYENMQRNAVGKALLLGFAQTAGLKEVQNYLVKGAQIASKVVEIMAHILAEENISESPTYDSEVLKSTTPPFSDKLMMFQVSILSGMSLGYYGSAIGTVARRDLGTKFIRILLEAVQYAEDGANIMIEHGWMEKPPASIDEIEIAKTKKK